MVAVSSGNNFRDPWLFTPMAVAANGFSIVSNANSASAADTTAFFTELATRGLQDQTDWTANTYKTILNVSSGKGLVAAYIGPTCGGAETHDIRFTVDGVVTTLSILSASGFRPALTSGGFVAASFTTAGLHAANAYGTINAGKTTFGDIPSQLHQIPHWGWLSLMGTPLLRFNSSLLIEARNSAGITNSTATAYSGVMYRLGL